MAQDKVVSEVATAPQHLIGENEYLHPFYRQDCDYIDGFVCSVIGHYTRMDGCRLSRNTRKTGMSKPLVRAETRPERWLAGPSQATLQMALGYYNALNPRVTGASPSK